tara:strand:- start:39672 stop:40169 length:498 start_codon:yes stop_codon:yes gene_type:complete
MSNARILANLMGTSTTVPSSKLSLVKGDMPSGSLLNAAMYSAMQQVNVSSSTSYVAAWTIDYTPVSSNSVLYFYISTPSLGEASNRMDLKLNWRGGTDTELLTVMDIYTRPSGWDQYTIFIPYQVGNNATTQGTLTCTARSNGEGIVYINYSYAGTRIIVNEVAA